MYASLLPHTRLIFKVDGAPLKVLSIVGGVGGSMVTFDKLIQPLKILLPKLFTLLGIVIERKDVQLWKAVYSIKVSSAGNVMFASELQFSNARSPIVVMPSGSNTNANEEQFWKT